ncbi:MAG: dihydrolipoyl dehydrogenase, partial [Leptospiraceae bacterium]|nr:dihydrolipoyl dehydrogenase [Leptospiraceae bacterium]
ELAEAGVLFVPPAIDRQALLAWKNSIVAKLTGGLGQLAKQRKIERIQGSASFMDGQTLRVVPESGPEQWIEFEKIILATGSHPVMPADWPVDSPRLMNSTTALDLVEIPQSLLVVGGGYIGLELGSVYASLGSAVSVVEMTSGFLPGADPDLVIPLKKRLDRLLTQTYLKTRVTAITETASGLKVDFENETGSLSQTYDRVLVAMGRKPNSTGLGLKEAGITLDAKGFVVVNEQGVTSNPHVLAIGDVAGEPMLAHKASHQGLVAAEVCAGHNVAFEPKTIPAVVFTDPEIAWCGLTEVQAKAGKKPVKVLKFPWAASGRSLTLGRSEGVTKLIVDENTEQILGVALVGPGAGELISEGALAIEMGATAKDMALTIHPHPTLSETYMEAAEAFYGLGIHVYRPKK